MFCRNSALFCAAAAMLICGSVAAEDIHEAPSRDEYRTWTRAKDGATIKGLFLGFRDNKVFVLTPYGERRLPNKDLIDADRKYVREQFRKPMTEQEKAALENRVKAYRFWVRNRQAARTRAKLSQYGARAHNGLLDSQWRNYRGPKTPESYNQFKQRYGK